MHGAIDETFNCRLTKHIMLRLTRSPSDQDRRSVPQPRVTTLVAPQLLDGHTCTDPVDFGLARPRFESSSNSLARQSSLARLRSSSLCPQGSHCPDRTNSRPSSPTPRRDAGPLLAGIRFLLGNTPHWSSNTSDCSILKLRNVVCLFRLRPGP